MKNTLFVVACATLFLTACTTSPDKTEPVRTEPAANQPAATEPPKAEPAAAEPPATEPVKPQPAKAQPTKPVPPKNEIKPAAPKEITLSSGLKMVNSKEGEGDAAATGDTVQVHYTGWLYEGGKRGNKFDSSVDRGQPFEMTIGRTSVIRGWTEGLVGMKAGGKRELIIPSDMGYGPGGRPPVIPPDATLDFEIEMLKITKASN